MDNIFAGLRFSTTVGQPDWDAIFKAIAQLHSPVKKGVFACGPAELRADLLVMQNKYLYREERWAQ